MKSFRASIQVTGFMEVEVDAENAAEAAKKIEKMVHRSRDVESIVFDGFETEPEEVE